jgi:RimJ/RimL family protein N-acetyltransferase
LREAFANWGLRRVRLQVLAQNQRGRRCYEKCGIVTDRIVRSDTHAGRPAVEVAYMSVNPEQLV